MRISIWIGLFTLAMGVVLSYLAQALIQTQTTGALQTTASLAAAVLFILFSATLLGIGSGLVLHWIIGFASNWKAFAAEMVLSFATFFMGIGAAIMSLGHWWMALQVFFTFMTASMALFFLSFISLFGGITKGFGTVAKYIKGKFKKKSKRTRKKR